MIPVFIFALICQGSVKATFWSHTPKNRVRVPALHPNGSVPKRSRGRSAKPLLAGSIPVRASINIQKENDYD